VLNGFLDYRLLSPAPAKRSGGYGNAGRPSEICCKHSKIFICGPIDFKLTHKHYIRNLPGKKEEGSHKIAANVYFIFGANNTKGFKNVLAQMIAFLAQT
jgi:hypothetical protein